MNNVDADPDKPRAYKRVLIKLSGEAFLGKREFGIDPDTVHAICEEIRDIKQMGIETGLVVGGGNIFRGIAAQKRGMDRVTGDNMGMLATVINALAIMDTLEKMGIYTRVMSAVTIEAFCETYIRRRAVRHMEKGRVCVFAAGTGNPYFSTDTAAALRAMETGSQVLIKATNVDGVYSADPKKHADAVFFSRLTYMDVLTKELKFIDSTAISLLKDNHIPLRVIDLNCRGNLIRAVRGEDVGTLVC